MKKKFTAILLATVIALTLVASVACNSTVLVYLEYNDGVTAPQTRIYDGSFVLPIPERAGYEFAGWYTDLALTQPFTNGTKMSSNFHLYAKWTAKEGGENTGKATLTFVYNDGVTDNWQVQVDKGAKAILPPTPSRTDYRFDGWWTSNSGGQQVTNTYVVNTDTTVYARWTYTGTGNQGGTTHTHDFGSNYFMFVKCSGCEVYGRNESLNTFRDEFVFDFDDEVKSDINELYDELIAALGTGSGATADEIIDMYLDFDDCITYLQGQYYVASTIFDIEYTEDAYNDYVAVANYFYEMVDNYYKLFAKINESSYASEFWAWTGWSQEDIDDAIASGDSYNSENQSKLDEIISDYNTLMEEIDELEYYIYVYEMMGWDTDYADEYDEMVAELADDYVLLNITFGQFVEINNQIAVEAGYNKTGENYMDYAYANDYNREYSPSEVATMRNYVKNYVGDIFESLANQFMALYNGELNTENDDDFYNALEYYPMFMMTLEEYYAYWGSEYYDSIADAKEDWETLYSEEAMKMSTNYVGNYFKWLDNTNSGGSINFYNAVNDVFKNGNYFTGSNDGAYTAWIPSFEKSIMYFGGISSESVYYYQSPFTFVHEFGHYYENVYNGGLSLSYDHDETQSQGNEMLFLAWLGQNKATGITDGYDLVRLSQLTDILTTVIMSTAVDEFEQVVYSGATSYNGQPIPTMESDPDVVDYQALYTMILSTYVDSELIEGFMSTTYWQVAFDSPCYYISYAMSALVSLEIYVEAMTDSLTAARNTYFKLFTFADQDQFVGTEVYDDGSSYSYLKENATYANILQWCGLKTAFDEDLYKELATYFD